MIDKTEDQIMKSWVGNSAEPIVTIRCLTYNHVNYLSRTLDGFLMQITTFPFEIIIHDDASTDGTTEVLMEYARRYPRIIVPIIQTENQYSKHNGMIRQTINSKIRGKYIAICEGDDYWIDDKKIEKQISFLEKHPEHTMCIHAVNYLQGEKIIRNDRICENERDISTEEIIEGGGLFCATASICCRTAVFFQYPEWRTIANVGDYPLQILMAIHGKVHYFPDILGVYRVMSEGSWSQMQKDTDISNRRRLNEIEWLSLLNRDTDYKYNESISSKIAFYAPILFKAGKISFKQAFNYITAMPFSVIKLKYYVSILKKQLLNYIH